MDIEKNKKFTFSEAFLLFLIPVYGYSLLYAYEYGYFVRLGIPTEFIEINFSALAKICAFLFSLTLVILGFLDIVYKVILHGKAAASRILISLYFILVLCVLPIIAFDLFKPLFPGIIVIASLYLISEFVFPLIKYKNIKQYWKKLEQHFKDMPKYQELDFNDEIVKRIGHRSFLLIIFLISFTYISFSIGAISAKDQENFLVVKSDPEVVLLRKYSHYSICSEFERNKRELLNKFFVLTVDKISEKGYAISSERVGPLSKKIKIGH